MQLCVIDRRKVIQRMVCETLVIVFMGQSVVSYLILHSLVVRNCVDLLHKINKRWKTDQNFSIWRNMSKLNNYNINIFI